MAKSLCSLYFISVLYCRVCWIPFWWYTKIIFIANFIGLPIGSIFHRTRLLEDFIENENYRHTIITLLSILPFYAYGWGQIQSNRILHGMEYRYLASDTIEGLSIGNPSNENEHIKFLGHVNQHLFFLLKDNNSVFISKLDNIKGFELKNYSGKTRQKDMDNNSK